MIVVFHVRSICKRAPVAGDDPAGGGLMMLGVGEFPASRGVVRTNTGLSAAG